jgi:8-oxo-dGTP diphosphatase
MSESTCAPNVPPHSLIARAIIVQNDSVLANRSANAAGEIYAALPGGHIDPGEDAKTALVRELEEELGARISVGDLRFVSEMKYLGGKKGHKPRHEVVLFFDAQLLHLLPEPEEAADGRIPSPEEWKNFGWVAFDEFEARNLIPVALREVLRGGSSQRYDFRDALPR